MRALLALALVIGIGACKDKAAPSPAPAGDRFDLQACQAAVRKARNVAPQDKAKILLDGCDVCGDWSPILQWNTPQTSGGPTQAAIEAAMVRCNAFCVGDAKLKFLGTLDDARGTLSRTPWRLLGDICKGAVSANPDSRFMSATYFALDRIARKGLVYKDTALDAVIDVPLPPTTAVGTNIAVPVVKSGAEAMRSDTVITFIAGDIYVDSMPTATLTPAGIQVSPGARQYPGNKLSLAELTNGPTFLAHDHAASYLLVTPPATSATALVPIIAALNASGPVRLAAIRPEDAGWPALAGMQVTLDVKDPTIKLGPDTTVQQLADILERQAASGATRVGVTVQ